MIHGKNRQPIKAQNPDSHVSKGPLTEPNRLTRSLGTRGIDKETRGGLPEQWGLVGPTMVVTEWAQAPSTFPLDRKLPHTFLKAVPGAWPGASPYKYERGVTIGQA